jgi:hypothetical protein
METSSNAVSDWTIIPRPKPMHWPSGYLFFPAASLSFQFHSRPSPARTAEYVQWSHVNYCLPSFDFNLSHKHHPPAAVLMFISCWTAKLSSINWCLLISERNQSELIACLFSPNAFFYSNDVMQMTTNASGATPADIWLNVSIRSAPIHASVHQDILVIRQPHASVSSWNELSLICTPSSLH